jgi:hypothetical protein
MPTIFRAKPNRKTTHFGTVDMDRYENSTWSLSSSKVHNKFKKFYVIDFLLMCYDTRFVAYKNNTKEILCTNLQK